MKKLLLPSLLAFFFFAVAMKSEAQWNLTGNANATATSILGTTNAIPLNLSTNNIQRLVIDANGKVGIGIAAPPNVFSVKGSGGVPSAVWTNAGAPLFTGFGEQTVGNADYILSIASSLANARPVFIGRRARGTLAAPTVVSNNDQIMSFLSSGYDGTGFQNPAAIDFFVDGTPTAGNVPARISFVTGTNGANRAERLKIGNTGDITMNTNQLFVQKATGNVGVGTISPKAKIEVAGQVKITGGSPAAGKVLTSDSAGLATWQAVPAAAETDPKVGNLSVNKVPKWNGATLANGTITDNGNIGIGEANPQGILHVSQPFIFGGVSFTGTGLNDLTVNNAGYTSTGTTSYAVRINNAGPNPNLIEISNDGGATFSAPFALTNPIVFANGVTAHFNDSTNHTFGDQWTWSVSPSFNSILIARDGKIGIGMASPTATLDVNGDALINGITAGKGKGNVVTNTVFGNAALANNVDGRFNTAIGFSVLDSNSSGQQNTAIGYSAMQNNTTGTFNTACGRDALLSNTTSNENSAFGCFAMAKNTTGEANVAVGIFALNENTSGAGNVAMGRSALVLNTTGNANVAIGIRALRNNHTGSKLVAVGDSALFNQNGGNGQNTAVGSKALFTNVTGTDNTAVGFMALNTVTSSGNVAVGSQALFASTSGFDNTAAGFQSLFSNTTGFNNTAVGNSAMRANTSGVFNAAMGNRVLESNTSGSKNTAMGNNAMEANRNGTENTAMGNNALQSNTTGSFNTAIGSNALQADTSGIRNTVVGRDAMNENTSGSDNTAMGEQALFNNKAGTLNTAIGERALLLNTSGFLNTANGAMALLSNTTGSKNTALGDSALKTNNTGSSNTAIGFNANVSSSNLTNASALGANAVVSASNSMQLGSTSVTSIKGGNNVTIVSDARFKKDIQENVPGLSFISQLRPVTYTFDIHKLNQYIAPDGAAKPDEIEETAIKAKEQIHYTGFLAQEVEKVADKIGFDFSGVYKPQNNKDPYGLSYSEFVVPLVKAVQELSKKNEELGITNEELKKAKADQEIRIAKLETMMQQLLNSKSTAPCPPLAGQ